MEHYVAGFHAVLAALEEGRVKPTEILIADSRNDNRARRVREMAHTLEVPVRVVSRGDLDLKSAGLRHQGVLALLAAESIVVDADDILRTPATPDRLLLVLDGVQDPHNLGACLRSAEAAGACAVVIPKDRAVGLTPAVRKVAAGSAERMLLLCVTNIARTLAQLKEQGYWLVGLTGDATETLYDADLSGPLVLILGAEEQGLRRLTREACDRLVRIPMQGKAESLNVSVAAAVSLFEAFRQRQGRR